MFIDINLEFDFNSLFANGVGSLFNSAFGRDCKGRPQGDYFYNCQVTFNIQDKY